MNGSRIDLLMQIDEQWLPELMQTLRRGPSSSEGKRPKVEAAVQGGNANKQTGIAVMRIRGPLTHGFSWWAISYADIAAELEMLANDSSVGAIILQFESPGGSAFGSSELSKKIYELRTTKRIVALADPYMFSAAYHIGSAAEALYVTPSGMVGSVGAFAMHVDYSGRLEKDGIAVTFVQAGEKKTDGNPYEPLSERARHDLQTEVDSFYRMFVEDVARNRGVSVEHVKEHFGQGGRVLADDALRVGMVDGIITLEDLLQSELASLHSSQARTAAASYMQREKLLLEIEELER